MFGSPSSSVAVRDLRQVSIRLPETIARLIEEIETRGACIGAQLWVALDGDPIADVALGDGLFGPMSIDTVHNLYCVSKPLLATTILTLIDEGILEPSNYVADFSLPNWCRGAHRRTIAQLLEHRAGLGGLTWLEYCVLTPPEARDELLASFANKASDTAQYSEVVAWRILEEVCEAVTGCDATTVIFDRVLKPLGLTDIALNQSGAARLHGNRRISVPFAGLPARCLPQLSELLECHFDSLSPATGALMSARDAGRFFDAVRRQLVAGDIPNFVGHDVLVEALTPQSRASWHDAAASREMLFASGFMVDLRKNRICDHGSRRSFGHNAGIVHAVAISDPECGLTASMYLNGASLDQQFCQLVRMRILGSIYRDLALDGSE